LHQLSFQLKLIIDRPSIHIGDKAMMIYLSVAAGVAVSVILPLIRPMLPKPLAMKNPPSKFWEYAKPYLVTAIFSLIVALIIVALLGDTLTTWQAAFIAGYTADSTLQKLSTGNT
jgi:hypothetical protein